MSNKEWDKISYAQSVLAEQIADEKDRKAIIEAVDAVRENIDRIHGKEKKKCTCGRNEGGDCACENN